MFIASLCLGAGARKKKDFCHSTVSVTKVSSQHMASGIAAVMTLPCSGAPGPGPGAPPFLLPFIRSIKTVPSCLCQGVKAAFAKSYLPVTAHRAPHGASGSPPNMGLDQVQGPGPLLRAEIRIWEPGGVHFFFALGEGFFTARPRQTTSSRCCKARRSSSGFSRVTIKSALLPGAIEPVTSPMPASCALRRVAV